MHRRRSEIIGQTLWILGQRRTWERGQRRRNRCGHRGRRFGNGDVEWRWQRIASRLPRILLIGILLIGWMGRIARRLLSRWGSLGNGLCCSRRVEAGTIDGVVG